ncbi:DedA family protein [Steroidobacter sp. S1-65]|uniref:DedA family protein n=1 Tax=Steroidobacter gossypii TaxID=2805490 RepID=A0ABS1WZW2_9GAMM|nr:DedA family protein [Steroidobacter gossypii]MBM0106520.1 DedA family protein [Steroidobacter gossypii]
MVERIVEFLESAGYWGILLLMFLENVFPPLPSELIMPFAGFAASRGDLNGIGVVAAGTLGSLIGAAPWYWAGRVLGRERLARWAGRHGQWLTISEHDVNGAYEWFQRHCGKAVLFGRVVPAVRTLISVPAGITHMSLPRFILFTTIGSTLWNAALVFAGFQLGAQYEQVAKYMDPVTKGIIALILVTYVYRVVKLRREKRAGR